MTHFLVVFDRLHGRIIEIRAFPEHAYEEASNARHQLEREYLERADVEVVVLTGDSLENLVRTHSRYFKTLDDQLHSLGEPA